MATTNKIFCRLSFSFGISCLVFLIVSFASDRWVVSTETQVAGFKNLGLWSACFARFRPPTRVMMNKYFDGCWWVFDREMDDLRSFLIPPWFVTTQVLVTVSLVFQFIAIIMMIINAINCFPHSRFKDEISLGLSTATTILHGLTAILLTIAVIMFGARADNERTWLEKPDQNYLSWSFGLCVLAAFLAILAFLTTLLESYRMWLQRKNREEPDDIFTIPPPAKGMMGYPPSNSRVIYPAHAGRFSHQESQSAGNMKLSEIISGKATGELYANSSYDVDETRQRGRTNGYVPQDRRQETRQFDNESYKDNVDSAFAKSEVKAPSSQSYSISTKTSAESTDYEEAKKIKQPVLPEYIPKAKPDSSKDDLDSSFDDESYDSEDKLNDDDGQRSRPRKTKSSSKGKKTAKNLTNSKKDKNKRHSETKTKKSKKDNSDDERSRSRSRSKKSTSPSSKRKNSRSKERSTSRHQSQSRDRSTSRHQSQSRDRSSSRHRSHSRDLNSVYTDSCSESDSVSVVSSSRQRQKIDKESSEKGRRRHKSSEEFIKKDKHGRSTTKTGSSTKKRKGSYSDDISEYSSKQQSKLKVDKSISLKDKRTKSLDFSDSESLSSKHSKRGGHKSKSSYSSYYEY